MIHSGKCIYFGGGAGVWTQDLEHLLLEPHLPPFLALGTFQIGSHIYALTILYCHSSVYASYLAGTTGAHHCTQLFTGWDGGLINFLPRLAENLDPPDLCLLSSWDYRHEPLCLAGNTFYITTLTCILENLNYWNKIFMKKSFSFPY
jgi:hypothetical protein